MDDNKYSRRNFYPIDRKHRDTRYSETYRLTTEVGLDTIYAAWYQTGMYRTGRKFKTSPYVIRYLAHKHGWKRPAELAPAAYKGVLAGTVPAGYYKTLEFQTAGE